MVNKKSCVFVICFVIIALFVVFVYLMTTVDPDPIVTTTPAGKRSLDSEESHPAEILFPVLEAEGLSYGLERASDSDAQRQGVDEANIIPLYRHLSSHGLLVNGSDVREVVSPIQTPTEKVKYEITDQKNLSTSPVKGLRRSINDIDAINRIIKPSSDVILKIIDDVGIPRIEIKLEPNKSLENNRYYRISLFNQSEFDNPLEDGKSTFVKILPGNTVVIDKAEKLGYDSQKDIKLDDDKFSLGPVIASNQGMREVKNITLMMTNVDYRNETNNGNASSVNLL